MASLQRRNRLSENTVAVSDMLRAACESAHTPAGRKRMQALRLALRAMVVSATTCDAANTEYQGVELPECDGDASTEHGFDTDYEHVADQITGRRIGFRGPRA